MKTVRYSIVFLFACYAWCQSGFNGPGRYEISTIRSGKVIDLDRNNQTTVIQFASRGTDNQTWDIVPAEGGFYFFRNGMNGNALTEVGNRNGTPVEGTPFNGGPNQQWRIDTSSEGDAMIASRSGRVLDIPDGTDRDGARIQIFERNGGSNQRFAFRRVAGGNLYRGEGNQGQAAILCASDDGGRRNCQADTRGGVRLTQQISGSPCIEGQTWGLDGRGIWVDRGCRAEFQIGGQAFNGGAAPAPVAIPCASDDGGRRDCPADTRGGVRMVRQLSGSPCIEGRTWGFDGRGIWVDRGCRAEFEIVTGPPPVGLFRGNAPPPIVCESDPRSRRTVCQPDVRGNIRMVRQLSEAPCIEGETWGVDQRGLWVGRGCRAEFQVGGRR